VARSDAGYFDQSQDNGGATMAAGCCGGPGGAAKEDGKHARSLTITRRSRRRNRSASASGGKAGIWLMARRRGTISRCDRRRLSTM